MLTGQFKCPLNLTKGMNTNLCFLFLFKIYVFYIDRNSMNIEKLLIQPNTGVRFLKPRWCRLTHLIRELKWAFLGKKLSVVCCYCRCRQLITISSSFEESMGWFQPNLAQRITRWRVFKFVRIKGMIKNYWKFVGVDKFIFQKCSQKY